VQFCNIESRAMQEERLIPITEADIARRLSQSQNNGSAWISENEHWSLGGQQSKFALRKQNGEWFSCEGSAATTHILKSGIRELDHQALNEYVCMSLAKECGINTASVEYSEFSFEKGVEPAIIIERYDRQVFNDKVVRLHQEDLCQALGCLPDNKYTMHGGPSCSDILRLLSSTGLSAQANVVQFVQMLFFNYLLAATDAHAKNYSLMLSNDGNHILAPMYDVASIAPYIEERRWGKKPPKLAMSIGGENRIGYLTPNHLSKFVTQCNLDAFGITVEGCIELLSCFAEIIPEKLSKVFDNLNSTSSEVAAKGLRALMEKPIIQLCRTTVQRFSSQ
ncbi:MAG: HipA domain-containing protein, partial [Eggerthellaceae bacterium]